MFIYNNDGYLSIRMTQNTYFNGRLVGSNPSSGVSLPDLKKIAWAYGISYYKITGKGELKQHISKVLKLKMWKWWLVLNKGVKLS